MAMSVRFSLHGGKDVELRIHDPAWVGRIQRSWEVKQGHMFLFIPQLSPENTPELLQKLVHGTFKKASTASSETEKRTWSQTVKTWMIVRAIKTQNRRGELLLHIQDSHWTCR